MKRSLQVDVAALCDEIERLRALTEWQPIETAPKDGSLILLAWWDGRRLEVREGRWVDLRRGRWSCVGVINAGREPTHWRPLGELPKVTT